MVGGAEEGGFGEGGAEELEADGEVGGGEAAGEGEAGDAGDVAGGAVKTSQRYIRRAGFRSVACRSGRRRWGRWGRR